MSEVGALCLYIVTAWAVAPPVDRAQAVCEEVGAAALVEGLSPVVVLALAFTESRFNPDARSPRDAVGPLQVIPWFHCPNRREKGCDLIGAGVRTIHKFRRRFGSDWLCHWNSGNKCVRRSRLFARIVVKRIVELSRVRGNQCHK